MNKENALLKRSVRIGYVLQGNTTSIEGYGKLRETQSVQNVVKALSQIPSITGVTITEQYSELDQQGIDIVIQAEGLSENIGIQVKSQQKAVREFRRSVAKREKVPTNQVNNWLTEHRLIVLNGFAPQGSIITVFHNQLDLIKKKMPN